MLRRSASRAPTLAPFGPDLWRISTGGVRDEMLFEAVAPSHASGGSVRFEPGARTAWHAHPRGRILIVTAGTGRVQNWGGPIEEIRAGDVVRIARAGQKHWHGASPQASMTHIAITEHRDGAGSGMDGKGGRRPYNAAASPQQGDTRPSGPRQQAIAPGLAALTDDVLTAMSGGGPNCPHATAA